MEATFQVVRNFSNIRNVVIFDGFSIFLCELEFHLISEEKLQVELHYFLILFKLEVVVQKHFNAATD